MSQYTINIGALPNDGTGDPLRTAFNEVNLNFDQVFAAGPVLSNIRIANNSILTTNTNGNLVLNPNGIGVVQANAHVVPDSTRIRNLGSSTNRWNYTYTQYVNVAGDASIGGNLSVVGNVIQIGNIVTDSLTIQLANTAGTPTAANGSGITVGANDNIATLLYNSTGNVWTTNIGVSSVGNITAPYFIGNGSQLTGLPASYSNADVATFMAAFGSNVISTTGNVTVGNVLPAGYVSAAGNVRGANLNTAGDVSAVGNVTGNYIIGNGSQLTGITSYANANVVAYGESGWAGNIIPSTSNVYSLGNSTNQWSDLYVSNATIYMNNVPISLTAGNVLTVDGADVVTTNANGQANIGNLNITGTTISIADSAPETYINISSSVEGWAYVQVPTDATANVYNTRIHNDAGNVEIGSGDFSNFGPSYTWTFDNTGNLLAPGNIITPNNFVGTSLRTNLEFFNFAKPITNITTGANTVVTLDNYTFGDPWTGQVVISNVTGATEANATWWYQASNPDQFELFTDNTFTTPVDSTAWGAYVSGGFAVTLDYGNIEINAQTVTIQSGTADYNNQIWSFNSNGSTRFPELTVNLHNGGNQSGQVLQFSENQQAIITGPTPAVDQNAQRIIIQGQRGLGTGEGGDVYLWAGDSDGTNGGDIKIYAGDADGVAGYGGYVNIDGGTGENQGGQVEITGGSSSTGPGGYTNLVGGYGARGGNVGLQAGYGASGPGGWITIQAGGSANGLAEYGNVGISAGASSWAFDNTGNLLLPSGGSLYSEGFTPSGNPGNTIILNPHGSGSITNQKLMLYPTAGDGDHLHMTTGNLYQTELFLGSDDFYVKLSNTGNVVINSNDSVGNSAQWTFDALGNLSVAGSIIMPSNSVLTGEFASPAPSINGFHSVSAVTVSAVGNVIGGNLLLTGGQIQSGVPTVVDDGINSISLSLGAQMDVYGFPFTTTTRGQLTITGDISTTEALGTWYYQSVNTNTYQLYTDSTYTTLVDATTWTPYTGGGSVAITENIPLANVVVNANGFKSTFTTTGDLVIPGDVVANNIVAEAPFTIQAGNFAAVAGARYGVDTYSADGAVTATLPATPATGDSVFFADAGNYANNGSLTIDAGSNTIMDNGNTLVVTTNNQSVGLFWNGRTWRIYNAG